MIRVLSILLAVNQMALAVLVHRLRREMRTVASGVAAVVSIQMAMSQRQFGDRP